MMSPQHWTRRRFLATSLGSLAAFRLQAGNEHLRAKARKALGTTVRIQLIHEDTRVAEAAFERAFHAIEHVETIMSLYRPESQLRQLNTHRELRNPAPELIQVLRQAEHLATASNGAFDVTVQPLWELNQTARKTGNRPTTEAVQEALAAVDYRRLEIRSDALQLRSPARGITLNGIAQGFASDQARLALRQAGIQDALIDCGELAPLGQKAGKPWRAGIQHPRYPNAFTTIAQLQERCLATSGDYASRFGTDFRNHHIFDPQTGHSPTEIASATVAAPSATLADGLSTTLLVLGIEAGSALLKQFPGTDALLVDKEGHQHQTSNFPSVPA